MYQKDTNIENICRDPEDFKRTVSKFIPVEETENFIDYFESLPNKQQAWIDLLKWISYEGIIWVLKEEKILENIFQLIPDRQKAWDDLINLIPEETILWSWKTEGKLGDILKHVPDKQKSWGDLIRLTTNKSELVRGSVTGSLGESFQYVPDKQSAWNDLIKLIFEEDRNVRGKAAEALGRSFQHVSNKQSAWDDLIELTSTKDSIVRWWAAEALGKSFQYVPDKQKAWDDLVKLVSTEDKSVKWRATEALGKSFQYMPDEKRAWDNLIKLSLDNDQYVRILANHSLGRISIYRASLSKTDENYVNELKKAINFFEKASSECIITGYNPSYFCLSFYQSFFSIISVEKQKAKDEIDKYLLEAKKAIKGSKNKKLLFEAVNNLANALKEVQKFETIDLEVKKEELNFYRKYCEQAAELMDGTEKTAPYATVVIRKGLPILDRKLKSLLEEIQEKATTACRESKGTDTEEIACAVSREVQKWEIGSQEEMSWYVENLVLVLNSKIPHTPENREILERIESLKSEKNITKQYNILPTIIGLIPTVNVVPEEAVTNRLDDLKRDISNVNEKLDQVTISLKSGISQELVITAGGPIPHFSIDHVVTISLQEISYPELEEDLEKIRGKTIDKFSKLPIMLAEKIEEYLLQNKMYDILKKLI